MSHVSMVIRRGLRAYSSVGVLYSLLIMWRTHLDKDEDPVEDPEEDHEDENMAAYASPKNDADDEEKPEGEKVNMDVKSKNMDES